MKKYVKKILLAILLTFLLTSILMGSLVYLLLSYGPNHPRVREYQSFSSELVAVLEENGISYEESFVLIGARQTDYLAVWEDETKFVFRVPESVLVTSFVSSDYWREFNKPQYDPPVREKEFGDLVFTREAARIGGDGKLYMTDPQDGYVYLRLNLSE